eukprot:TRINITY_DN74188_c0_g1_i1.p1 TRINITY_DN74188_c0_g1~~TRINITY_DN74188_c0_g1_i1.p1  ORF type:complete len:270 (-),score=60.39 TRINITY_DN74188_c0_g1_i1:268-1077(-)
MVCCAERRDCISTSASEDTSDSSSEEEPAQKRRRQYEMDDYDVCKAITSFAERRHGARHEQEIEDLRDEIRVKRDQASRLARRARAAKVAKGDRAIRLHYEGISKELSAEIRALEAQLMVETSRGGVAGLEQTAELAFEQMDANRACRLAQRAAACLSPPRLQSLATARADVQKRLRRVLLRVLCFLDLNDADTRRYVRRPCSDILALVDGFELRRCVLNDAEVAQSVRQWERLQRFAEFVCGRQVCGGEVKWSCRMQERQRTIRDFVV